MTDPEKLISALGAVLSGWVGLKTLRNGEKARVDAKAKEDALTKIAQEEREEKKADKTLQGYMDEAAYWKAEAMTARDQYDKMEGKFEKKMAELEKRDMALENLGVNAWDAIALLRVPGAVDLLRAHAKSVST